MESIGLLDGRATLFPLPSHEEGRGRLQPLEFDQLPFTPVRSFIVDNVPAGTVRGKHAHKSCSQLLICVGGKISVNLEHAGQKASVDLSPGSAALFVVPEVYNEQVYVEENSVLLVFADAPYDPQSYIFEKTP